MEVHQAKRNYSLGCHSREGGNPETIVWIPGLLSQATPLNPRMTAASEQLQLNQLLEIRL